MTATEREMPRVSADQARWVCPPDAFTMTRVDVPENLQTRAVTATRFALSSGCGFHLVAVGPPFAGREALMQRLLEEASATREVTADWCYVFNFDSPNAPRAIDLPPGKARTFRQAITELISDLRAEVPRAFEAAQYESQRNAIIESFGRQRDEAFGQLRRRASELGFALMETPQGIAITPVLGGQPISPDAYAALDPVIRARFEGGRAALSEDLENTSRAIRDLQRSVRDQIRALDESVAKVVVEQRVADASQAWEASPKVVAYLQALQRDVIQNIGMFRGGDPEMVAAAGLNPLAVEEFFRRYGVNVVVDRDGLTHAPVVVEPNPTYANLIGSIERRGVFGTLVTDFSMIKSGALLRANGGFLLLELRDVLTAPFAWDGLKHALLQGEVKIEDPGQGLALMATASLEPEPIPLELNVVLLTEAQVAYIVAAADPDFGRLFKIRAEFQDSVERTPEHIQDLASYLLSVPCDGLPNLDASGVARIIEEAVRRVSDQRRLSAELEPLGDIAREAMQLAHLHGRPVTDAETVREAISARIERSRYVPERLQAMIVDDTIMIATTGEAVGQINGLEVMLSTGDRGFGKPVRITARAFAGTSGVVNIDREVELGGPIHSKSVLILNGYLGGKYGRKQPLSLSASVVFEQTYQPVEGDSASLAELFTILSALSGLPLRQSYAVTGSMNQHGDVQAIGGINEKIEGFYDICFARGLTGDQGVVFPAANLPNLMLREDVVQAVADGRFSLFPVSTVDQGIEHFTGVAAGSADADGNYPPESVHGRVAARLAELAAAARKAEHGLTHATAE